MLTTASDRVRRRKRSKRKECLRKSSELDRERKFHDDGSRSWLVASLYSRTGGRKATRIDDHGKPDFIPGPEKVAS